MPWPVGGDFVATLRARRLLVGMKQIKTVSRGPRVLQLRKETVRNLRLLERLALGEVGGGMMHTSFSCGNDLCTTHLD
jgi:hypothetical protein